MSRSPQACLALLVRTTAVVAAILAPLAIAAAPACTARSGAQTTALVELYTSEGCDSCPPADRWLATTFAPGFDFRRAVPLAFHVDYWDRLGWKDRFAAPGHTERQYAEMRAGGARFVYTPQVLVQGRDFAGWRADPERFGAALREANARPARAGIALAAQRTGPGVEVKVDASVPQAADRPGATLYVALVDSGLVSDVKAGENAGVRLAHDHVVRAFRAGPAVDAAGAAKLAAVLPWPAEAGRAPTLVAFVQNAANGHVLQALALTLDAPACAAPE
jgi:hypothetical protein